MQDEERIVRCAQEGNTDAFAMLYAENFDKIYRYMTLRVSDRAEAEDMTQQVFVKAFEALPAFRWRGAPFSSWLFRIAHNEVIDRQRKHMKQETEPLDCVNVVSGDDLEGRVETKLAFEQVVEAAGRLTHAQREVISLRFGAEMSIAETARIMGKNEGAVKALQHSAVAALKRLLWREDNDKED